jgi:hypothetical protein
MSWTAFRNSVYNQGYLKGFIIGFTVGVIGTFASVALMMLMIAKECAK